MVLNKLVHSGNLPLEHERAYARLLGKLEYNVNLMHLRLIVPWLASNQTCNTHVHERHLTIFQRNRGFKAKKGCLKIRIRFKFVVFTTRANFFPGLEII